MTLRGSRQRRLEKSGPAQGRTGPVNSQKSVKTTKEISDAADCSIGLPLSSFRMCQICVTAYSGRPAAGREDSEMAFSLFALKYRDRSTGPTAERKFTMKYQFAALLAAGAAALSFSAPAGAALTGRVPEPGMITMADFGTPSCQPCRLMRPFLEKLDREYEGRVAIRYIDSEVLPEAFEWFRITSVPTQIFFDHHGQEVGWHAGYLDEGSMREQIEKMLKAQADEKADQEKKSKESCQ